MRLVMERFERGNSDRLDFEQFKIFWLGQVFPYWRNMIFQGARHIGIKFRGYKARAHGCRARCRKCIGLGSTAEEEFFNTLLENSAPDENSEISRRTEEDRMKSAGIEMMQAMHSSLIENEAGANNVRQRLESPG